MSVEKLRVEFTALSELSRSFADEASDIETLVTDVARWSEDLGRQSWAGQAAQSFTQELLEVTLPATQRLSQVLSDTGDVIPRIVKIYLEADQAVASLFKNGSQASAGQGAGEDQSTGSGAVGKVADITKYQNGVNGWSLISTDGSQGFTPNELVNQIGGTCALYGPLNLLIQSGYDISQTTADTYVSIKKIEETSWLHHLLDIEPNGFDMDTSANVISDYTSKFQQGDFIDRSSMWTMMAGPNRAKAEDFLVKTVQSGKPVLVSMEVDDSFGMGSGGHRATVVGVKTGADGKMESVLVGTNWAGQPVYEVPAKQFMDDWMDRKGGAYITVDRNPVTPKPAGSGFSADMLRIWDDPNTHK